MQRYLSSLLIILILGGCYSPITSLEGYLPSEEVKKYPTVDALRKTQFTTEAYKVLKNIPVVEGITPSGYAAGSSNWSTLYSLLTGTGWGRKIVFDQDNLLKQGYVGLIHEDIHHLDDIGRDGGKRWIDVELFKKAYYLLSKDSRYKGIQLWCESRANDWIANTFGVGEAAEHIAYIGMFLTSWDNDKKALKGAPDYLIAVYSRILKRPFQPISTYKAMDGSVYEVIASSDSIDLIRVK